MFIIPVVFLTYATYDVPMSLKIIAVKNLNLSNQTIHNTDYQYKAHVKFVVQIYCSLFFWFIFVPRVTESISVFQY